jgi:PEP-CTERM motif
MLGFTQPTTGIQFRTSQSFGDDFVGGGGTRFDPNMFGTVLLPTPEPATWLLMAIGSVGLFALARRRKRAA